MKYKATTTLCLAALLLACAAPGFGQEARRSLTQPALRAVPAAADAPAHKAAVSDVTLRFFDLANDVFDFDLGGDFRAVGTFFKAPFDGTLDRVNFEMSNFGASPGIRGTGTLRIKLVASRDILTPATAGIDSLDLNFSQLAARPFPSLPNLSNRIDLSAKNFDVEKDVEYFLQLSLVDESADAALTFVFDGGTEDSMDTRYHPARTFLYALEASNPDSLDGYAHFTNNPNLLLEIGLVQMEPPPGTAGRFRFIHNAADLGAVDVFVGGQRVAQNLAFQRAIPPVQVPAGPRIIDVVASSDPNNLLLSTTVPITPDARHVAVALPDTLLFRTLRGEGSNEKKVPVLLVHGGVVDDEGNAVDFRLLDSTSDHAVIETLVEDLAYGSFGGPVAVPDSLLNLAVYAAGNAAPVDVYKLDLRDSGGVLGFPSLVLATSGILGGTPPFTLLAVSEDGTVVVAGPCPSRICVSTATEDAADLPEAFALYGNYPNPFNPTTTIRFDLGAPGYTTLKVYNLLGQEVATLVAGHLPAQSYQVAFDAAGLPSGPYLYRLQSGAFTRQKMLMLVK